jgi:MFS family permease
MVLLSNLIEAPGSVVLAVFAREEYGSAADFGLLVGVLGGSALAGALVYSAIGHRLPRRRTFLVCFSFVPLGYLALATLPSLPLALAALGVAGFAAGPINPLLFTVQTEITPSELRGRVFGAVRAGAWAAIPLGILLGGVVVAAVGVAATFLAMGVLLAAVVGYGYFNPAFREMDSPG